MGKRTMRITLDLPKKVLSEKAENTSVEGLIADALAASLDDPEAEEEMHLMLSEKYLTGLWKKMRFIYVSFKEAVS